METWIVFAAPNKSLPSRGAWIEIDNLTDDNGEKVVAPLAGSVDRNTPSTGSYEPTDGRTPRGEW